jgi:hypothetical protein
MGRKLYVEYDDGGSCLFREATAGEIMIAVASEHRRIELENQIEVFKRELAQCCKDESRVFYDSPGHPYDVRTFVASGCRKLI